MVSGTCRALAANSGSTIVRERETRALSFAGRGISLRSSPFGAVSALGCAAMYATKAGQFPPPPTAPRVQEGGQLNHILEAPTRLGRDMRGALIVGAALFFSLWGVVCRPNRRRGARDHIGLSRALA